MNAISLIRALIAAAALSFSTLAMAQTGDSRLISTPAEKFAMAPGGVDLRTGRYASSETDLSIGGSLTLTRILNADVPGHGNPFGNFSHNWDVMVSEMRVNYDDPQRSGDDYRIFVHFGGRSHTYKSHHNDTGFSQESSGAYAPLTFTGDRASASVSYTYRAVDGTIVQFRPLGALGSGDCSPERRCAYVSQITEPDGTILSFDYVASGASGGTQRLRSVTSSRGYALVFDGAGNRVAKACVVNLALTPLPASCASGGLAASNYTYTPDSAKLVSVTRPGGSITNFSYAAGPSGTSTMSFTRPGDAVPWLTNTITLEQDEQFMTQEVVTRQSYADGSSYTYGYARAPLTTANPYPAIVGGSYTDALGRSTTLQYDWPLLHTPGNPGSSCYPQICPLDMPDGFLNWVYQQTPGPVEITDPLGRVTLLDYCDPLPMAQLPANEHNRCVVVPLVSFTDPEGARTALEYDGYRNITKVTRYPRPGSTLAPIVTSAVYDIANPRSASQPLSMTDAMGNTTNYTYAPEHGGLLTETRPAPAPGGVRPQTRHSYAQRRAWIASGGGYQAGALIWLRVATSICRTSAATGNPASPCASAGDEVLTQYDFGPDSGPNNLLLRGQAVTSTDNGAPITLRTCYGYDALGRRISETRPNANLANCPTVPPAAAMPFTSSSRYDAANRVTGTIAPDPDGAGWLGFPAVRNSYDAAGRLIKVETGTLAAWQSENVAPSTWSGFSVDRSIETLYDVMGRKIRETLREGSAGAIRTVTQTNYDAAGRTECTAVRMNPADFGSPPASACTQGSGGGDRITRTVYDAADQRVQVREGVGTAIEAAEATWAYNLVGQIVAIVDGNGNRAEFRYDGHGRQDRWTFPSAVRAAAYNDATQATALASASAVNAADYEAYTYDPNGNRISLRKRDDTSLGYSYDALNRMIVKTVPERPAPHPWPLTAAQTRDVYYGYDLRGLQLYARFDSASGEGISSAYDGFGRLASSSTNMGGATRTLSYTYDRNGNRTGIIHPDGNQFATALDGLDRPTLFTANGATLAYQGYYQHGGVGDRVHANGATLQWGYDALQRRTAQTLGATGTAADAVWSWSYNPDAQVASVARNNNAYAWNGAYAVNRAYATNGLNQYSAAGSVALGYDANGNLASETPPSPSPTRTYSYDVENRLVSVSNGAALSYDPLGRLYRVTLGATTTRFLYDGDALVAEYDGAGAMTRRYVHEAGDDVPIVSYAGSALAQPSWLHADRQGSIVLITDAAGAGTINRYDEYGIPGSGNTGRFQYTGQIWLDEIGMYHYKSRAYSPTLGRFLQIDSIGYADQFNLYAYVRNDPVNGSDPSGTCNKTGTHICGETDDVEEDIGGAVQINRDPGYTLPPNAARNPEGFGRHSYNFFEPACEVGSPRCTENAVFEGWRHNSGPGAPYAQAGTHDVMLSFGNPIRQTVNETQRTIFNETRPGHAFHYGTVRIIVRREGNHIGARIIGRGEHGRAAFTNGFIGPLTFGWLGIQVRSRFLDQQLQGP